MGVGLQTVHGSGYKDRITCIETVLPKCPFKNTALGHPYIQKSDI
jgi:hypothetical protein